LRRQARSAHTAFAGNRDCLKTITNGSQSASEVCHRPYLRRKLRLTGRLEPNAGHRVYSPVVFEMRTPQKECIQCARPYFGQDRKSHETPVTLPQKAFLPEVPFPL
jgi:hypothetical protein